MGSEIRGSVRLFLTLTGLSLIVAGVAYLLFPHVAVGIVGIELPGTAAAIDARATYGGTQRLHDRRIGCGLDLTRLAETHSDQGQRPGVAGTDRIDMCMNSIQNRQFTDRFQ
jgi:hypothetical protein